jgi:hypothetical protein
MATLITSRTVGSVVDRRVVLNNSHIARVFSIGTNWNEIWIGGRYCFEDSGSNISGTPLLKMGLASDPNAGFTNGPLNSTCKHFIGVRNVQATVVRLTTTLIRYQFVMRGLKKIGSTVTEASLFSGATGTNEVSAVPATIRSAWILRVLKGSPNFTIQFIVVQTAHTDIPSSDTIISAMQTANLDAAAAVFNAVAGGGYNDTGAVTLAVDEATNGYFNAACMAWNQSAIDVEFSELFFVKKS